MASPLCLPAFIEHTGCPSDECPALCGLSIFSGEADGEVGQGRPAGPGGGGDGQGRGVRPEAQAPGRG